MGENIYMLPSDMNLKIRSGTVEYNNKILVSDRKFSLGKNNEVNALTMKSHAQTATNSNDVLGPQMLLVKPHSVVCGAHAPNITHNQEPKTITHNHEKIALVLPLASGFAIWNMFR